MNVSINAPDGMDSLLWASNNGSAPQAIAYSPFGSTLASSANNSLLPGFNGERLDAVSQTYHLGNGYRTYKPSLMRFNGPDRWSPFGAGGLNPYAYCEGDPINRADPSGHVSSGAIGGFFGALLGIVGAVFAVATLGTSIAALATVETVTASMLAQALATGLGVAAAGAGIASEATAKSDPGLSETLGWAALGLGIVSITTAAVDHIHRRYLKKASVDEISHDAGSLLDDASGTCSSPVASLPDAGGRVVQVGDKSFHISLAENRQPTCKAILLSHGGFLPLPRYLTGTADVEIPEGLKVAHCVRHGENVSTRRVSELMCRLGRGDGVPSAKNYQGRARFKNYTLDHDYRSESLYTSNTFDVIRPVGRMQMNDVFNGVSSGALPYDEIYFIFCRGIVCHW